MSFFTIKFKINHKRIKHNVKSLHRVWPIQKNKYIRSLSKETRTLAHVTLGKCTVLSGCNGPANVNNSNNSVLIGIEI